MKGRLLLVGPILVISLLVVFLMLVLKPREAPRIAFSASPTPTPTPTSIPASPTPTPTPTSIPTLAPTVAANSDSPSFSADIQPILNEHCVKCHSGDNPPRGLQLDSYAHVLKGSTYRKVVIPGDPEGSQLVLRIRGDALPRMPFDGPPFLNDEQIALIQAWIAAGAADN